MTWMRPPPSLAAMGTSSSTPAAGGAGVVQHGLQMQLVQDWACSAAVPASAAGDTVCLASWAGWLVHESITSSAFPHADGTLACLLA